jgi:SAM-dependent methyltransferase
MSVPYSEYDPMADVYAEHWAHVLAERIGPVLERLVLRHLPPGAEILDLCCGTGDLAAKLTSGGYAVTGIDGSAEMLRIARTRAPEADFILEDARAFSMPGQFDAVFSLFDSLNHILEGSELRSTFDNVYQALRPGGWFLFDLNTEEAFLERWDDDFGYSDELRAVIVHVAYDPQERLGRFEAAIFRVEDPDDECFRRSDVTLLQRPYEPAEVTDWLRQVGFAEVRVLEAQGDLGLDGHVGRVFFLGRRPAP